MALTKQTTSSAALVVLAGMIAGRLLGLVVQIIIASLFGTTIATDAYFVAFGLLLSLMSPLSGTVTTVLIPLLSDYLAERDEEGALRAAGTVLGVTLVVFGLVTLACAGAAGMIMRMLAPGFDDAARKTASNLFIIMSPSLLFLALNGVLVSVFHSFRHFVIPTVAALGLDIGVILAALSLSSRLGVYSLAIGVSLGTAVQLLLPLAILAGKRYLRHLSADFRHPAVKKLFVWAVPVAIASSLLLTNLLVDKAFATALRPGSVGALEFGMRVVFLPLLIFAGAMSQAIFPTLSSLEAEKDTDKFKETLSLSLRILIWVGIPSTVGLIVLRVPLVRLLYERGNFDFTSTQMTATSLLYYCLGTVGYMLNMVIVRTYFSLKDVITPMKIVGLVIGLNALLNLMLMRWLGMGGLALATSLSSTAGSVVFLRALQSRLGPIGIPRMLVSVGKTSLASFVMGIVCHVTYPWVCHLTNSERLVYQLLQVGGTIAVAVPVFLFVSAVLKSEELSRVWRAQATLRRALLASR